MSKEAYYFSHDSNARNDEKILAVRMRLGMEGYGIYWAILEKMRENADYMCAKDYNTIAFDLRVGADKVKSLVEDFELFQFTEDGKKFYSDSFLDRMKHKDSVSSKARESANARWEKHRLKKAKKEAVEPPENAKAMQTHNEGNAIKESKGKESKGKRETRALEFLKTNFPTRFETEFLMRYKSRIKNPKKFAEDFNDTVDQEGLEFTDKKLFARLGKYSRNWIENQDKFRKDDSNQSRTSKIPIG